MKFGHTLLKASVLSVAMMNVSHAAEWSVSITNLTYGNYFTPLLVTAHGEQIHYFQAGQTASAELQAMAEGGDLTGLVGMVNGEDADTVTNPAEGLLAPGATTTAMLNTDGNPQHMYLSVLSMILPSNDAFIGLNKIHIPEEAGTYTYNVNAYDAGTEANNEVKNADGGQVGMLGMPAADLPGTGTGATGVTDEETNNTVHIHRNTLGDTDETGGMSDLDSRVHRWLNPVARVTVTVK
ncbi:spondin domain-containing protein [Candidatus Albibeggiatoa sp. nov. NOAA]|uniref:spondin domain-containing protein n=1 Tax=Candidatus Albibeggiatoa sp. nov. NOAA TaxID=3162724 RepID=UPI0032FFC9D4|nr:spondin domain-containing protein [Thiotrichaceae bacterium]